MESNEIESKELESSESDPVDPFEIEESKDSEELDIYTEEGMESYLDEDSISAAEEGFMKGYMGA